MDKSLIRRVTLVAWARRFVMMEFYRFNNVCDFLCEKLYLVRNDDNKTVNKQKWSILT